MRRSDRLMNKNDTLRILKEGKHGIFATVDDDMQPYGVPISYVYINNCIYIHSTSDGGYKYNNLKNNNKVCFTIVGKTEILPDKFGTLYESAIAFGEAELLSDEEERLMAFREFIKKYCAEYINEGEKYIKGASSKAMVIKIQIKELTGKHRV